jgi:hypothetical protein
MSKDQQKILNFFYTNLDTIASIKDGHKVYINSDNTINIEEPYMFQGIWRYCYNVSRKDALHILNKLLNDIEIYYNALYVKNIETRNLFIARPLKFSQEDNTAFTTIINKLEKSIEGIANLKKTYKTDTDTCTELSKIINKISSLIQNFNKMIS